MRIARSIGIAAFLTATCLALPACGERAQGSENDSGEAAEQAPPQEPREEAQPLRLAAADAGCAEQIEALDARLASDSDLTEAEKTAFRRARDMAAELCDQGNEAMAQQLLAGLLDRAEDQATINKVDKEKAAQAADNNAPPEDYALGEPRGDLDRFYGLYALPDSDNRKLFVAPADNGNPDRPIPDGYLMVGAMWGDVAPWYMKSLADMRFEQQWVNSGGQPVRVEFQTGADGQAVSMSISSRYMNYDRMERVGALPEKWR
ncbi:hypothetical protein [Hyphococcus luteus]|nr:hypothetical protein [Marinicaulis flavus]